MKSTAVKLPSTLILLSPGDLDLHTAPHFTTLVERCVDAGLHSVLLREPNLSDKATLALAITLRRVLARGWLALHDRVHLCADSGTDAVHLGFRSVPIDAARTIVGSDVAIGFSAHASDDPKSWAMCDYLFFGPVFDTPSKRGLKASVGFDGLARATSQTSTPVWALGGIQPEHAATAIGAGAQGIAVLGGISRAKSPIAACTEYVGAVRALERR